MVRYELSAALTGQRKLVKFSELVDSTPRSNRLDVSILLIDFPMIFLYLTLFHNGRGTLFFINRYSNNPDLIVNEFVLSSMNKIKLKQKINRC